MDTNGEVTDTVAKEEKPDKEVDEVTDLFKGLSKKKKSHKPKESPEGTGGGADGQDTTAAAPTADDEFDPTALKKKKKKKSSKKADTGEFEAKLAQALDKEGAGGEGEEGQPAEGKKSVAYVEKEAEAEGDFEAGTGIWAHDATQPIPYTALVHRFFSLIQSHHPDLLSSGTKSYKIPPPQCLREGNRRTIFANISDIAKRMKRSDDHVMQFLFAELGTSGSVDGSKRLVIKGRFQQKQIENVLRRYIGEFPSFPLPVLCPCLSSNSQQLNMLHARPAAVPTRNSTRVRTGCISLPATRVDRVVPLLLSRPVSVDRSVGGRGKVKNVYRGGGVNKFESFHI